MTHQHTPAPGSGELLGVDDTGGRVVADSTTALLHDEGEGLEQFGDVFILRPVFDRLVNRPPKLTQFLLCVGVNKPSVALWRLV